MSTYLLVDTANLFYRMRHVAQGDPYTKAGLCMHLVFRSIKKMWKDFKADHVVFCLESKSWRYEMHPKYKAHRKVLATMVTQKEREENEVLQESFNEMITFIQTKTNATILQADRVEGDDFIARWTQTHPNDDHVIVSGDTDFIQLLAPNVKIYDGVRSLLIAPDSIINEDGNPVQFTVSGSGKLKIGKEIDLVKDDFEVEPEWWLRALFMKCMRGDSGDNIMTAYPRVRETKLKSAWEDRNDMGYNWNNLMLQTWDDDGESVRVLDKYNWNRKLIDLTAQPDDIKQIMDETIINAVQKKRVGNVGIQFMRFCDANGLINIGKEADQHAIYLNAPYAK